MKIVMFLPFAAFVALLAVAGCGTSSAEQQANDQAKCSSYGFQPGSNQFANCMMTIDTRRQDMAATQQQTDTNMKDLSIRRNGDEQFPICTAATMGVSLDINNNAWYGPNCRER